MSQTKNSTKPSQTFLAGLTRSQKIELRARLEEKERRRCIADAEYWLFKYARTKDEHDPSQAAKAFPDKEYIREVVRFWTSTRMKVAKKSPEIVARWFFCRFFP